MASPIDTVLSPPTLLAAGAVPIAFFSAPLLRSLDREFGRNQLALTAASPKPWTVAGRLKWVAAFVGGSTAASMFALALEAWFF